MAERVVAYHPSPVKLIRIVSEQAATGTQVMAAFLNKDAARAYLTRHPLRVVGEPVDGAAAPVTYTPPPGQSESPSSMGIQVPVDAPPPPGGPMMAPPPAAPMAPAVPFAPAAAIPMQPMQAVAPRRSGGPGQVFAVYSPRGGSGTSLVAAALAARIAGNPDLRVLLVDFDLQNGSQAFFFNVQEQKRCSVLGLKPLVDEILSRVENDQSRVPAEAAAVISEEILLNKTFRKDNLHVLCALDDPAAVDDYVDPSNHMEALVQILAANFDVVVLDMPNTVDMFTAPALFRSDRILVVTPDDIPSQIKVARMLNLVLAPMIEARELVLQERCFLVVSRSGKKKLEVPMPVGVAASLPDDKKFFEGFVEMNQKQLPLAKMPDTPYAKAVAQLAQYLGAGQPAAVASGGRR
jgi:pilus assembly protein CpaE